MKTTTQNPVFAKIRLYLKILASCVIVTCLFLIIIHPEAWITPSCIIVAMICLLFLVLDTTFHRIYGSAVLSRIGRQLHFLFFPAAQPPCIHPIDDNLLLYMARNPQSGWDKGDMIPVYKSQSCHPDKPFQWHNNSILSRHSK